MQVRCAETQEHFKHASHHTLQVFLAVWKQTPVAVKFLEQEASLMDQACAEHAALGSSSSPMMEKMRAVGGVGMGGWGGWGRRGSIYPRSAVGVHVVEGRRFASQCACGVACACQFTTPPTPTPHPPPPQMSAGAACCAGSARDRLPAPPQLRGLHGRVHRPPGNRDRVLPARVAG